MQEDEDDYVVVDKEHTYVRPKQRETLPILYHDYELLLHEHKIVSGELSNLVCAFQRAGITGNNRDLWLAAANCVITCMKDVIAEGEKLITEKS